MKNLFLILPLFLVSCATVKRSHDVTGGTIAKGYTFKGSKGPTATVNAPMRVKTVNPKNYYCKGPKMRIRKPGDLTKYNY